MAFLAAVLLVNTALFSTPIFEHTDYALNSLQIREAKAFHELLGNYSRWQFHHPGPSVFYVMAFGEWLFHDATRLVPAPMNAQILAIILFNIVFLFATVRIFQSHSPSPGFAPLALAAAALLLATINHDLPGSAPVSVWMPHVALFPFLFFLAVCASVATGEMRRLPLLAGAGMLLVHLHVAQCLFVTVLGGAACFSGFRRRGASPWRRPAIVAAVVACVFLVPILLEIALYEPDNLDHVLAYSRQHPGAQKSLGEAVWYFGSFLAYLPAPDNTKPGVASLWASFARPYVILYWVAFAALATLLWRRKRKALSPFLRLAALACAVASALFLFWGTRIADELYNFNGYFIYSVQLMLWLVLAALLAQAMPKRAAVAAWAAALVLLAALSPRFKMSYFGLPLLPAIAADIPRAEAGKLRLEFPHAEWSNAAGIAIQLARQGKPFCVAPGWEFAFGRPNVCAEESITQTYVMFAPPECRPPCRMVFQQPGLAVALRPPVWCRLPLEFNAEDGADIKENFNAPEHELRWTRRTGIIRFALAKDFTGRQSIRIRVEASTGPGRPAKLLLNGRVAGSMDHMWNSAAEFVVGREWFRPGEENRLVFEVPNAGPIHPDYRELGLRFERLRMEAVE